MTLATEKTCHKCKEVKPLAEFGRNKARHDGVQVYCKPCMREVRVSGGYDKARWETKRDQESARNKEYRARNSARLALRGRAKSERIRKETPWKVNAANKARKAAQLRAVPKWADRIEIETIYRKAKELSERYGVSLQVDHVVPLRGAIVSGLHTPANLQLLAADENYRKGNREWPDMP